ncbi:cell division protein DivIB [Staphylococcus felis]|uniref:cell division protein FtsQ/DivIB n=1 Tax=Staphylococcus felis TaxID=46127 RepID=UPI000E23452A|nr:cell division protein FtsQ/DivIB [Staphylococcus felis]MDQ7192051.1 FtsQ-type POTRA domain-containing protein [Staphylococcus felis]REH92119.1 cell division protein DivIB [Staphylococcus felis]
MKEHIPQINNEYLKEKRKKQLLKRRRRQRNVMIALVLLVVLIVLYMFTPISKISSATVEGNHNVSKEEVIKKLNISQQPRIYAYNSGKAKERIEQNDLIQSVHIKKGLFNSLTVEVNEYDIVGVTSEKGKNVPVLETGKVLSDFKGDIPNEAPYLTGFKSSEKRKIVQTLSEMDSKIRGQISEIVYAPQKDQSQLIQLFMRDGIEVLGNMNSINQKLKYYPSMSRALDKDETGHLKESGFIDLSVGATFIPYDNVKDGQNNSASSQDVQKSSASTNEAKEALQSALNKIKEKDK